MGVSTDAILAYGYNLGEGADFDDVPWMDEDTESLSEAIEDRLFTAVGFTEKWGEKDGYVEREREAKAKLGVELIYHCSDEYPQYILAASGTEIRASRGYPETITSLEVTEDADERLSWALGVLGVTPKAGPSWLLASNWG